MINPIIIYAANACEVQIPVDDILSFHIKQGGKVEDLDRPDSLFRDYINYVEALAMYAYERHGRLKKAPPYSAWLRAKKPKVKA